MTFNGELMRYSSNNQLLAKVDALWMKHRKSGGAFLHELPSEILEVLISMFEDDAKERAEYQKICADETRRLNLALNLLRELADHKRPFSRPAIKAWIVSLSVPLEERKAKEVKHELDNTTDLEGDDWLKHAREYFDEFKEHVLTFGRGTVGPLVEMPQHVAIGRIEQGLQSLGSMLNMMLLFAEQAASERKEVGKAMQDFVQDMEKIEANGSAPSTEAPLWILEVAPKLRQMLQGGSGAMTVEELKVLSACLEVAIRARDNKRK